MLVIGGGYTGLSTALHLARRVKTGPRARTIGFRASGPMAAKSILASLDPDDALAHLGKVYGKEACRFQGRPRRRFYLIAKHKIECDAVRPGWLQPSTTPRRCERSMADGAWSKRGIHTRMLGREETAGSSADGLSRLCFRPARRVSPAAELCSRAGAGSNLSRRDGPRTRSRRITGASRQSMDREGSSSRRSRGPCRHCHLRLYGQRRPAAPPNAHCGKQFPDRDFPA